MRPPQFGHRDVRTKLGRLSLSDLTSANTVKVFGMEFLMRFLKTATLTLGASFLAFCASAPGSAVEPAQSSSKYTRVNDRAACQYKEDKGEGGEPASCEFLCNGPVDGVKTRLLSCYDYEHLHFQIDGNWYSTWNAMLKVGGMSGLGNKNGLVEWVFDGEKPAARRDLQGLVARFNGTNAETSKTEQALAVFGLQKGGVCWKGNYADNAAARAAVREAKCQETLEPEQPEKK